MSSREHTDTAAADGTHGTDTNHESEDSPTVGSLAEEVSPDSEPLDLDTTFEILRNERRRIVLSYLIDADGRVDIGDLAERVAAVENDCSERAISSSQRKRAYVGLYQCHLSKMADAGVIEYDRDRGHVEATPAAADLFEYVNREDTGERNWLLLYQGTACVVAGTYLVAALAATAVSVPWALVGASTLLFGVVAGAHALLE